MLHGLPISRQPHLLHRNTRSVTWQKAPLDPYKKAKQRKTFIGWALAYMACVAITSATGSDIPFFVLMGVQLIKQSPDALLQVRTPIHSTTPTSLDSQPGEMRLCCIAGRPNHPMLWVPKESSSSPASVCCRSRQRDISDFLELRFIKHRYARHVPWRCDSPVTFLAV